MKFVSYLLFLLIGSVASAQTDVVVVGASPAGIVASVAAAREGESVVLIEEFDHVGGIVSGGLTNNDIRKFGAVGGFSERQAVSHDSSGNDSLEAYPCGGDAGLSAVISLMLTD